MDEESTITDRESRASRTTPYLRIRLEHGLLFSALGLIIGVLSYTWNRDRADFSDRKEEHAIIKNELRVYTTDQVNGIRKNLDDFREWSREVNTRQDREIEWIRKATIQLK